MKLSELIKEVNAEHWKEEEKPSIERAKENYRIIKETMREFKQGEKNGKTN